MLFTLILAVALATSDSLVLEERIDLYEPATGAFLGSERTWFGPDGRRLRLEITDEAGKHTLMLFVLHDDLGRESEAIYFESGPEPDREKFTYSDDGRLQTTTYYYEPDVPSERTETFSDSTGRERWKRYYRANGEQYGAEDVLWDSAGTKIGWDFRYVGRDGETSFRYLYEAFDDHGSWIRRVRTRDGVPERVEVRTTITRNASETFHTSAAFAFNRISTAESETSPSFTRDGKTVVFARYGDDWESKRPYIAELSEDGWSAELIAEIEPVYNLAISPNGNTIVFSRRSNDALSLFRMNRNGDSWSTPEDLTAGYGLSGSYPVLAENGSLFFFDANGANGPGIYVAPKRERGFGRPSGVYVGRPGDAFDPYVDLEQGWLLVTQCFDASCQSGMKNGIWEIDLRDMHQKARKLAAVSYGWGAQPVDSLGIFVFTDGEDILAIPLNAAGLTAAR